MAAPTGQATPSTPSTAPLASAGRAAPAPVDPRTEEVFFAHPDDPLARFQGLLGLAALAARHGEQTAMTLCTVGDDGRPSSRIVLLKAADAAGFTFFTNLGSRKGRELLAHPDVALLFHWVPLEVQVRIEGRAGRVPDAEADAYFASRPRGSQLGAWASQQSAPLSSREVLEARLAEVTARFAGGPVPRPEDWSGLRVVASSIEFWRNRESRLHDRELYTRAAPDAPWSRSLLFP